MEEQLFHSIYDIQTGKTTKIPFTKEEMELAIKNREELKKTEYINLRADAYPSIVDQLDMIYNEGIDAWKEKIKSIKDQFPKPVDTE